MTFRPGFRPPPMDKHAQAATGRARTLALPALPAGTPADEHVSVAGAAELLITSQQSINRSIVSGVLPAYRLDETRRVLVADLVTMRTGRRQAAQVVDEQHRQGWHKAHLADGACSGPGCKFWTHADEPRPSKRTRPASPALLRHLSRIRKIAAPINEARQSAARDARLADIAAARLAASEETTT